MFFNFSNVDFGFQGMSWLCELDQVGVLGLRKYWKF